MKRANFKYQIKAAKAVLQNALSKKYLASVLAACPSAGKTTISQHVTNMYLDLKPMDNVVVLTEGQNTLKNQYLDELKNAHIPIKFTYGIFGSEAQVQVGVPQAIARYSKKTIDLLIVDEAHNFFLADMVQNIIKTYKPKYIVLLTGSPTKYNLLNQTSHTKYGMYYISAEDLKSNNVFSTADMDVVPVESKTNCVKAVAEVMKSAKYNGDNTDKIMIACPSIKEAIRVSHYMKGVGRKVSLSTSKNDKDDTEIYKFKANQTNCLIVVGKGILGLNDKNMTMLIDLKSSSNVDSSYQLFARILRTHPQGIKKTYFRIGEKGKDYNAQVGMLYKMKSLMDKKVFMGYNGKNLTLTLY